MKIKLNYIILILAFCFGILTSCKEKTEDAVSLNNSIINDQTELLRLKENLFFNFQESMPESTIQLSYDSLKTYIIKQIEKYNTNNIHDKYSDFQNSMLKLLIKYQELTSNEYFQLKKLITKPAYLITNEDIQKIDSLYNEVNLKHFNANEEFAESQKKFAKENKIELID